MPRLIILLLVITALPVVVDAEINVGESLDWIVADSDVIVRGKISEVSVTKHKGDALTERVTIQVEEIIKGKATMIVAVDIRHYGHIDAPSAWKKDDAEVLLFLVGDESKLSLRNRWGRYSAVRLTKDSKGVFTTDFRVLTDRAQILKAVNAAVADGKGKAKSKEHRVEVPFGTEAMKQLYAGSSVYMIVPANERLEAEAKRWLKLADFQHRMEGVNALRHFKSDDNIELLKSLFGDPDFYTTTGANNRQKKVYAVRKTSFEVLTEWGEKVDRPITEEFPHR